MGVSAAAIDQYRKRDRTIEVWPDNFDVVHLFIRASSQWHSDNGIRTGLIYPSVESLARAFGIAWEPDLVEGLQVMESATLRELARRREQPTPVRHHGRR